MIYACPLQLLEPMCQNITDYDVIPLLEEFLIGEIRRDPIGYNSNTDTLLYY